MKTFQVCGTKVGRIRPARHSVILRDIGTRCRLLYVMLWVEKTCLQTKCDWIIYKGQVLYKQRVPYKQRVLYKMGVPCKKPVLAGGQRRTLESLLPTQFDFYFINP